VGLEEDTVRKHYESIGEICPTGPTGRILFFENNIVGALRRNTHAFEDKQEWSNSLEGQNSEGRKGETETLQHQEASPKVGSRRKKKRLGKFI